MNKNVVRNVISVILAILMIVAFIYLGTKDYGTDEKILSDKELIVSKYNMLDNSNVYKGLNSDETSKFIAHGTGYLVICTTTQWCNYYMKYVDEVAKELGITEIYYFDITKDRSENSYYYKKIVKQLENYLLKNDENESILSAPQLFKIEHGKIINNNNESAYRINSVNVEEYWNDAKILEFNNALRELISE